jgi:DNA-directed RNA polymerase sigma subunit (sigma70/sigma32)
VIFRYYWHGETMEQMGTHFGLHQSRMSQVRRSAIAKLRALANRDA